MDQKKQVAFLGMWLGNTVIFLLASAVFGNNVVLGNERISGPLAAVVAGLILTVLTSLVPLVVAKSGHKIKDKNIWAGIFLVANIIIVWLIKRLAIVTGLGISNNFYVLILAVVLMLAQWGVAKATGLMAESGKK